MNTPKSCKSSPAQSGNRTDSVMEDVSQLTEESACHYEALLDVLEGLKGECERVRLANKEQERALHAAHATIERQTAEIGALAIELQARDAVVERLQDMMGQLPQTPPPARHSQSGVLGTTGEVCLRDFEEAQARAAHYEGECQKAAQLIAELRSEKREEALESELQHAQRQTAAREAELDDLQLLLQQAHEALKMSELTTNTAEEAHNNARRDATALKAAEEKLQQQEEYITHVESMLSTTSAACAEGKEHASSLTKEVVRLQNERRKHRQCARKLAESLSRRAELAAFEAEDQLAWCISVRQHGALLQKEHRHHSQGVIKIKDEQLKVVHEEVELKEKQVAELRDVIKELVQNIQSSLRRNEELQSEKDELAAAARAKQARLDELVNEQKAAQDTRKQVKREVHGMLSQAKQTEQSWQSEKSKFEEALAKQRAKLQALTTRATHAEQAAAEAKKSQKKSSDRAEDLTASIERTFAQICSAPMPPAIELLLSVDASAGDLPGAKFKADRVNPKQKLQYCIDAAQRCLKKLTAVHNAQTVLQRQHKELQIHCEEVEAHGAWLEGEWNNAKERREEVERAMAAQRDELTAQSREHRSLIAAHDDWKHKVGLMEEAHAREVASLVSEKEELLTAVLTLTKALRESDASLKASAVGLRAAESDTQQMHELEVQNRDFVVLVEKLKATNKCLFDEKEALATDREQLFQAKAKYQKNTTRYLADLKKARTENSEMKTKVEASLRTAEQLKRQIHLKETELKTAQEVAKEKQNLLERKDKELKREEGKRMQTTKETADTKSQLHSLITQLHKLQRDIDNSKEAAESRDTQREEEVALLGLELAAKDAEIEGLESKLISLHERLAEEKDRQQPVDETAYGIAARGSRTPKNNVKNAGERAHADKMLRNRYNTLTGVQPAYANIHKNNAHVLCARTPQRMVVSPQSARSASSCGLTPSPCARSPGYDPQDVRSPNPTPEKTRRYEASDYDYASVAVVETAI